MSETTATPSNIGALAGALAKAQALAKAVGKDAKNKFHGYKYASAEAVIEEARKALAEAGVAVFAVRWEVEHGDQHPHTEFDDERKQEVVVFRLDMLRVHYRVMHGAEWIDCETVSYIVPEKGRPDDKAQAGALTTNLSYFLRALLLLPREDEGGEQEVGPEKRDDSGYQPRAPKAGGASCPKCGAIGSLIAPRSAGDAWFCFPKKGGCGARFSFDPTAPATETVQAPARQGVPSTQARSGGATPPVAPSPPTSPSPAAREPGDDVPEPSDFDLLADRLNRLTTGLELSATRKAIIDAKKATTAAEYAQLQAKYEAAKSRIGGR